MEYMGITTTIFTITVFGNIYHHYFLVVFCSQRQKTSKIGLGHGKAAPVKNWFRCVRMGDPYEKQIFSEKVHLGVLKAVSRPLDAKNGSGSKFCIEWR